ncbi:histidine kinase [Panacibacter sp. DH6]|uniref:Histidine kinase n=1 Tax=Panacibacter microcysteis TaxID=2793269 RepID=A0A931E1L9_9BACT|nr:histidine kinase [Panacibacter microcysteis]MBG9375825.1 histidine kinase [Panacibacter microcysteis]
MQNKTQVILINITGCILFLALPLLFAPPSSRIFVELKSPPTVKEIIAYSLLIVYFYLNFFVLIPKYYFSQRYSIFAGFTIVCFFIITLTPNLVMGVQAHRPPAFQQFGAGPGMPPDSFYMRDFGNHASQPVMPPPPDRGEDSFLSISTISHHLFLFLGVFFFSLLLKINIRWKKAEEDKLNTELSYLKLQVNPHFLFNTLNSIYALALEQSENTATAVVKLSAMMRYVLTDAGKEMIALEKDIAYITSFVDLQQLRFGNTLPLTYAINGDIAHRQIAPLILIPFIENAFKHGVNAEEASTIVINITVDAGILHLMVQNNKVFVQLPEEERTGVGIANARNRLKLLYPGKHSLLITDAEKVFTVSLKLHLS